MDLATKNTLVNVNQIVNGYFYTFDYTATSMQTKHNMFQLGAYAYDKFPIIYCLGPKENNLNCFAGINFNHLSNMKKPLWEALNKYYHITNDDIRHILTIDDFFHISKAFEMGLRFYNRKNIRNPRRIINTAIPEYIEGHGAFVMSTQQVEDTRFSIDLADKGIR